MPPDNHADSGNYHRFPYSNQSSSEFWPAICWPLSFYAGLKALSLVFIVLALVNSFPHSSPVTFPSPPSAVPALEPYLESRPSAEPSVLGSSIAAISAQPAAICTEGVSSCPAGTDSTTVTITYDAGGIGVATWPAVEVLFLLETTPYDGVFDRNTLTGAEGDPCAEKSSVHPLCDESNGVPYFVANAGNVASALQSEYPSTKLTFGLADFGATYDNWGDSNGSTHYWPNSTCNCLDSFTISDWATGPTYAYHVDVGNFVEASQFESTVTSTFQQTVLGGGYTLLGSNLSSNFLHSDSITALYGALNGVGVNWTPDAHHVIVLIGSTAPRDPSYIVNYCMSNSYWSLYFFIADQFDHICETNSTAVTDSGCEPSYTFETNLTMPACFGWINSQDLLPNDSIAALSKDSPECLDSLGHACTIDTIDLFALPTNPNSPGWICYGLNPPLHANESCAGGWWATTTVHRIVSAGCDLANATGGTWDGPDIDNCGTSRPGTLLEAPYGSDYNEPNTTNPTLFAALENIGFGAPPVGLVAVGSSSPMFSFIPFGNFRIDLNRPISVTCSSPVTSNALCMRSPLLVKVDGVTYLTWNWSTDPNANVLYAGDSWSASFSLQAWGPPYGTPSPVDACTGVSCRANGSGPVGGLFSSVTYEPAVLGGLPPPPVTTSFPLALVVVDLTPNSNGQTSSPGPPPPGGPGLPSPSPVGSPIALPQPIITSASVALGTLSLTAVAAGILSGGFTRILVQRRAIAQGQPVGNKVRPRRSAFEDESLRDREHRWLE
jgi:hypothetical protein